MPDDGLDGSAQDSAQIGEVGCVGEKSLYLKRFCYIPYRAFLSCGMNPAYMSEVENEPKKIKQNEYEIQLWVRQCRALNQDVS